MIAARVWSAFEEKREFSEKLGFAGGVVFLGQSLAGLAKDSSGPGLLINDIRREGRDRFVARFVVLVSFIDGNELLSATALVGAGAAVLVDEKEIEGGEQEGAELAFGAIGGGEGIFAQQAEKELLGQVLRLVLAIAGATHVGMD